MAGVEKSSLKDSPDKTRDGASNAAAQKLSGDSHDVKPNDYKERNAAGTHRLVEDGKLPPLTVSDHKQWTVAVLLATTGPGDEAHPDGFGAESKLKQLKQMAKETEGKSVNFIVSVERSLDSKGQLCHQEQKLARKLLRQGKSIRYVAETFGVHFTTLYRYLREANV